MLNNYQNANKTLIMRVKIFENVVNRKQNHKKRNDDVIEINDEISIK